MKKFENHLRFYDFSMLSLIFLVAAVVFIGIISNFIVKI